MTTMRALPDRPHLAVLAEPGQDALFRLDGNQAAGQPLASGGWPEELTIQSLLVVTAHGRPFL
jgi:hypothetical protein